MKFCVFSRGKTTENGSVSAQRSTWQGAKHLKVKGVCQFFDLCKNVFWNLHKIWLLMVVLCRSAKHFYIVLCVWIFNSELHHVRIFVTPCSFYVLLQCDGKAVCFFGIKMPAGWQNFIENPNRPDCVGWSKEQCSVATRDCCLTDRADHTVGPTLSSEKSSRVFWSIAPAMEQLSKCTLLYSVTDCI